MAGPYWQATGPQLTSGRGPERRRSSATSNGVERIEIARKAPSQARRYDRANVRDQSWRARAHGARLSSHGMQPLPHRGMEPQKRKYVTQITDGRGAASYIGDNKHTHWKKGTRHDLDFGPLGRRALHRPRHAHCAVVDLHSGLKARTASSAHSKLGRPDFQAPAARNGGRFAVLASRRCPSPGKSVAP
jgi:hypothetical protein